MKNKWIFNRKENSDCQYRLFCLPYAGSGASLYSQWSGFVDHGIEVCPIQLPGRENRRRESLCSDYTEIVGEMCDGISELLDKPFGIFGYSMGGILAYELTLQIYQRFGVKPKKLFMSASSIFRDRKPTEVSQMDDRQLTDYMERSGGIPQTIGKRYGFTVHQIVLVNERFPTTGIGKIDVQMLLRNHEEQRYEIASEVTENRNKVPNQYTDEENLLMFIWAEALHLDHSQITPEDDFFTIGGNSAKVPVALKRMNEALRLEINAAEFVRYSTIRQMLAYIHSGEPVRGAEEDDVEEEIILL